MIGTDWEKGFIAETPLGRTGKPDDIGDVVVFLASNESRLANRGESRRERQSPLRSRRLRYLKPTTR
jgi:NAD(P)-dependent dehydrogenase (short-subunit alcohol dehydrogenase family)